MIYAVGLVGSVLLAIGSYGAGSVPAGVWHLQTGLGIALCVVGVLLLVGAWWRLRTASAGLVLRAAALWSVPLLVSVPLFSRDVYSYAGQAHLVDVGLSPYSHGPAAAPGALAAEVDDVWASAASPYGPLFLRVASWLVPGQHVIASVLLLRLLAVAGLGLLAWALLRLGGARACWLGVANPLVLLHAVSGAHNDVLMAGLMAAGPVLVPTSLAAAAALVMLAALVKLPAVVALAFLPLLGSTGRLLRGYAVVAVSAAVTLAVVVLATGLGWGWVHTLLGAGSARRSLLSVTTGLGVLVHQVDAVHVLGLVAVAAIGAVLLVRARRIGVLLALGLTLLAFAVLGPVVQPWYLLWALPALAVAAGPRLAVGLGAASAVLCLLILPNGRHLIRPPLYGVPAVLAAAVGYAASRRGTLSPDRAPSGRASAPSASATPTN